MQWTHKLSKGIAVLAVMSFCFGILKAQQQDVINITLYMGESYLYVHVTGDNPAYVSLEDWVFEYASGPSLSFSEVFTDLPLGRLARNSCITTVLFDTEQPPYPPGCNVGNTNNSPALLNFWYNSSTSTTRFVSIKIENRLIKDCPGGERTTCEITFVPPVEPTPTFTPEPQITPTEPVPTVAPTETVTPAALATSVLPDTCTTEAPDLSQLALDSIYTESVEFERFELFIETAAQENVFTNHARWSGERCDAVTAGELERYEAAGESMPAYEAQAFCRQEGIELGGVVGDLPAQTEFVEGLLAGEFDFESGTQEWVRADDGSGFRILKNDAGTIAPMPINQGLVPALQLPDTQISFRCAFYKQPE